MENCKEDVMQMIARNLSSNSISCVLQQRFPHMRGISARSVRRFCRQQGISRPMIRVSDATLDRIVNIHIQELGHSYG